MENKQSRKPPKQSNNRNYSDLTKIKLWVRSGGRCEFKGCNKYLLIDDLTQEEANFSDKAHIVPVSDRGARGGVFIPQDKKNNVENLMLMCKVHHKLIDDKELRKNYPTGLLLKYKKEHEDRIYKLTGVQDGNKTFIVRLRGKIDGEAAIIRTDHIKNAILPHYIADEEMDIDLSILPVGDDSTYWKIGKKIIGERIEKIYLPHIEKNEIDHVSIFALAPIPFLIHLGNRLSNAIETDMFHLQKDGVENWTWRTDGKTIEYQQILLSKGKDQSKVALLLSLSGPIKKENLPDFVKNDYWIYEISLNGIAPNRMFMRKKDDLVNFKHIYRHFLSGVMKEHKGVKEILLFPAIPTPVAVSCGRDLIKKADPTLVIYDFNKNRGGFRKTLKVN